MTGLIADIGGTNARFALVKDGEITDIERFKCADYAGLTEVVTAYLEKTTPLQHPAAAAIAVAAPVESKDRFTMTNHPWSFNLPDIKQALGFDRLEFFNDFAAISHAVPHFGPRDLRQVGDGTPRKDAPAVIIGPGSGLGVGLLVFTDGKAHPLPTEGGHVTMHAQNDREYAIIKYIRENRYDHVSAERLLSGPGLEDMYVAVAALDKKDAQPLSAARITEAALSGNCGICAEVLDHFCGMLGSVAGNLALSALSYGGVYIAGGIVPRLGDYFFTSRFREQFLNKGRMRENLAPIPTYVITHPYPAFVGLKTLV